ncbi:MAG: ABC transporter permease [Acidobacteriota bacterium]
MQATESLRDQRGLPWLVDALADVRYACRLMRKQPGFTVIAAGSLALGIGANTAAFSWADALLLRPLAIPEPAALVNVGFQAPNGAASLAMSYREFLDLRTRAVSFANLTAFSGFEGALANDATSAPQPSIGLVVGDDFLRTLGLTPSLGRDFRADEMSVPGRDPVVLLSHDAWQRRFSGDPGVLGRVVQLNGTPLTVIGISPPGFHGLDLFNRNEFYVPAAMWTRVRSTIPSDVLDTRVPRYLSVRGRLSDGVTVAQAQVELDNIGRDLARAFPDTNRDVRLVVRTELAQRFAEESGIVTFSAMLLALAVVVMLTACANVAGLLTSRAPSRAREVSLRLAVGASRGRVLRQLLAESVAIAAVGSVGGLGVAYAALQVFRRFRVPTDLPIAVDFSLDDRALIAGLAVAALSAVVAGLLPAVLVSRSSLTAAMKPVATPSGRGRWPAGAWLAGLQITFAVVLLIVAAFVRHDLGGRLVRGPGFQHHGRLMAWFDPDMVGTSAEQAQRFYEALSREARDLPGVRAATLTSFVPMDGGELRIPFSPEGVPASPRESDVQAWSAAVDESYFETLGITLREGRSFTPTDDQGTTPVAIVNTTVADKYWPGQSALGKRFRAGDDSAPWVEVVGVAPTTPYFFLIEPTTEFVYFPRRQSPRRTMALVLHADAPEALATPVRALVKRLDGRQPILSLRPLSEQYRMRVAVVFDILMTLVTGTATMGIGLALVGLYGLVAYDVSRRTKEVGVRVAIGARTVDILRLVLGQGLAAVVVGLIIGVPGGIVASRVIAAALPGGAGLTPADAASFAALIVAVTAVTLLAAYVPARRALRIAPTEALRCE